MSNNTVLFPVRGGIGKNVIFTALINQLCAQRGGNISIASTFPNIFRSHPKITNVLNDVSEGAIVEQAHSYKDIVFREPYISNYCKRDRHILDEWASIYDLEPLEDGGMNARPDLQLASSFYDEALDIKKSIPGRFFLVQWTGGQPPRNLMQSGRYPDWENITSRNVQNYNEIWLALAEAFPEHIFILYALPNEPVRIPESISERVIMLKTKSLNYAALLTHSDGFIGLDSSLQHFAAARQINKKGVVLWGGMTSPEMIGYSMHKNISSEVKHTVKVRPEAVADAAEFISQENIKIRS